MQFWTDRSILTSVDSYKTSHWKQYPPKTQIVSSYIEAREGGKYKETVFFGMQAFVRMYLEHIYTKAEVDFAEMVFKKHGVPFNKDGWYKLIEKHNGILPLKITAVEEGTVVPVGNVLVQVENTDEEFPWLTSWIETALMRAIWYPMTVATVSHSTKKIIWDALVKSCMEPDKEIMFKLHDFGARGATSHEAAALGGAAHLVNFMGTDTVEALLAVNRYYNGAGGEFYCAGYSIPASEHSTITTWGRDGELKAYENMLDAFKDSPIIACVSDSYDLYNAVSELWGEKLRQKIIDRNGTLVVRPDSGDPVKVPNEVIMRLATKFGYSVNKKGYKVLPSCVRVIQGDGCTPETIKDILHTLLTNGYSAENIAFGMGGGLLQKVDRDTVRVAMKASAAKIDGKWIDVYKDPLTDSMKKSKRGKLELINSNGSFKTVPYDSVKTDSERLLKTVWDNGKTSFIHFDQVRKNANGSFVL